MKIIFSVKTLKSKSIKMIYLRLFKNQLKKSSITHKYVCRYLNQNNSNYEKKECVRTLIKIGTQVVNPELNAFGITSAFRYLEGREGICRAKWHHFSIIRKLLLPSSLANHKSRNEKIILGMFLMPNQRKCVYK